MRVFGNLTEVVKTSAQSPASCLPTGPGVAADNDPCIPTQSALCVHRSSPALMEVIGRVRHCTSAAVCVINHRLKRWSCWASPKAERWRKVDPVLPWRTPPRSPRSFPSASPGQHPSVSEWKSGENSSSDPIWFTLSQRWEPVTNRSPASFPWDFLLGNGITGWQIN